MSCERYAQSNNEIGISKSIHRRRARRDEGARAGKDRYATFGFNDKAKLDDGAMWPTAFALTKLTAADEARIVALINKALS